MGTAHQPIQLAVHQEVLVAYMYAKYYYTQKYTFLKILQLAYCCILSLLL
jgi:hypothetical protein